VVLNFLFFPFKPIKMVLNPGPNVPVGLNQPVFLGYDHIDNLAPVGDQGHEPFLCGGRPREYAGFHDGWKMGDIVGIELIGFGLLILSPGEIERLFGRNDCRLNACFG
jgi:hypothetical protein